MTGLPALTRAVEQLPTGSRALVIASVPNHADEQTVETQGDVSYQWLHTDRTGHERGHHASALPLPEAVRSFDLLPEAGYVWAATEASDARSFRKYFHRQLSWHPNRFEIKRYWRRDKERCSRVTCRCRIASTPFANRPSRQPIRGALHASVVLGFETSTWRDQFFAGKEIGTVTSLLKPAVSTVHAYDVEQTLAFVKDAHLLPQFET